MSERAYVFVHPPDEQAPRLAGQVIVMERGTGAWCRFKYATSYLDWDAAFPLDPIAMPLGPDELASEPDFELFNAVRDAGPDYWGRKVIEHRLGRYDLTELDYLLASGAHRVGALVFSTEKDPPRSEDPVSIHRLGDLVEAAHRLEGDEPIPPELAALLGEGSGTLGGMRPKATVAEDGVLWVAKLPARDDRLDWVRIEAGTLELARRAGLAVPDYRLIEAAGRPILLTRRFDRRATESGTFRAHYLSGLSMTGLHERDVGRGSYAAMADWLRSHGADPLPDLRELFHRIVFNVLIGNEDDHLRNHAAIRWSDGYHLSPAYDLVPQPAAGAVRRQALAIGDDGRASSAANALTHCERFGLSTSEANASIDEVRSALGDWRRAYRDLGLGPKELTALESAIDPER